MPLASQAARPGEALLSEQRFKRGLLGALAQHHFRSGVQLGAAPLPGHADEAADQDQQSGGDGRFAAAPPPRSTRWSKRPRANRLIFEKTIQLLCELLRGFVALRGVLLEAFEA